MEQNTSTKWMTLTFMQITPEVCTPWHIAVRMGDVVFRPANKDDCNLIVELINELAEFEKLPDQVHITAEKLAKDGFCSDPPFFQCIVAEDRRKIVGYALYFFSYSTTHGEFLYLEDLYITESYRQKGIGKRLLREVASIAESRDCYCMQWCVLNWNEKAIKFYQHIGAFDLTLQQNCQMLRITKEKIQLFASKRK